jgi:release factor glutamine methyltransferase
LKNYSKLTDTRIQACFNHCIQYLQGQNVEDAELTVLYIFEYVFKEKYVVLLAEDVCVSEDKWRVIISYLNRYCQHEPLSYILGEAFFRSNRYIVRPGVLIPRPETEELVDYVSQFLKTHFNDKSRLVLYECGVGSGVISIELARQFPMLDIVAWDVSDAAIAVTTENIALHKVTNIKLQQGSFFLNIEDFLVDGRDAIIVSNPPYISESMYGSLTPMVRQEPYEALVASDDGLTIIKKLMSIAMAYQCPLICEIGYDQAESLLSLYSDLNISIKQDMNGKDRFLFFTPSKMI